MLYDIQCARVPLTENVRFEVRTDERADVPYQRVGWSEEAPRSNFLWEYYDPMLHADEILADVANLPTSRNEGFGAFNREICHFARRWGVLRGGKHISTFHSGFHFQEPLVAWRAIIPVAQALRLHNAYENSDTGLLATVFTWGVNGLIAQNREYVNKSFIGLASPEDEDLNSLVPEGDLMGACLLLIQHLVNEGLEAEIYEKVMIDGNRVDLMERFTKSRSLLGALWLMLAERLSARKPLHHCPICFKWYNPFRSDQKYCSKKCNQKAKRQRAKGEKV